MEPANADRISGQSPRFRGCHLCAQLKWNAAIQRGHCARLVHWIIRAPEKTHRSSESFAARGGRSRAGWITIAAIPVFFRTS